MKRSVLMFLVFFLAKSCYSQINYNFDFEKQEKGFPIGINISGNENYKVSLDSTVKKNGNYSILIENISGKVDFRAISIIISEKYNGKKITLSGYIKTENISEGYAGLWMRIDPNIAFDNMNKNGIKGTTDWQKCSITLNMNPEKTTQIIAGGLLVGNGKMWIDDLSVSIDGKNIGEISPVKRKLLPVELDKEFDKGSKIDNIRLDAVTCKNLKDLGLIWGFLKYYHPNIAKGDFNWDYELFRILPKVLKSDNYAGRDAIFVDWINKLGTFEEEKEVKKITKDVKITPDLDWIEKSNFSKELTALLLKVKNAKRTKYNYYVQINYGVGNPDFSNENPYSALKYPDAGYRLLTVYRYWNIIQYFFPYKNLIEGDWKNILEVYIQKIINAKDEKEYVFGVLELIAEIHDTHANIWSNHKVINNYYGINNSAVEVSFIENKAIVIGFKDDKLGRESGLKIGDEIIKINGQLVEEIVKNSLTRTPASNYPTQLRDIAPQLLRSNDTIIKLEIIRDDNNMLFTIKTFSKLFSSKRYTDKDTCFRMINSDIAYINNGSLKRKYLKEIWKEMQNSKGLIIDDRNYPSDFPIYELSNYLMPKRLPFVKFSNTSLQNPGLFTFTETLMTGKKNKNYYKGKVVVLINEISQSSAEFHAMAYKMIPNVVFIGSTTAGADGNVSRFFLPGGIFTMISGIGVYYPDGKETQRIGILSDIEMKPTINGIKKGNDELLDKAIEIIRGK